MLLPVSVEVARIAELCPTFFADELLGSVVRQFVEPQLVRTTEALAALCALVLAALQVRVRLLQVRAQRHLVSEVTVARWTAEEAFGGRAHA